MLFRALLFLLPLLLQVQPLAAQGGGKAETAIRQVLQDQLTAWNAGNLEGFMAGYWKDAGLQFITAKGITTGWDETLRRYQAAYPDKARMGTLAFNLKHIEQLSKRAAIVVGEWVVTTASGEKSGYFTLLFKKIAGEWRIVMDHTS